MLDHSQLFARLAEGHAARITVVTPNQRLAHRLTLDFDDYQLARGLTSWEAADILPFGAFVERLWEDALYSDGGERLPLLLTAAQEQHLWERILAATDLLIVPQAAAQCREAWRLLHAWRIPAGPGNEDALAFAQWSAAYRKQTEGEIDAARLPDLMADRLQDVEKPALVVAYGFDVMPPQTREFLGRYEWTACAPPPIDGRVVRASFPSAKHELEAAAKWARARLEAGAKRIGVVVPELGQRRAEVVRVFSRVMQPGYNLPAQASTPLPFNISLGRPLALSRRRGQRARQACFARRAPAPRRRRYRVAREADRRRRAGAAPSPAAGESVCGRRAGGGVACRLGAALLRGARGGRLPGRAAARFRRIPDAREVARGARRARQARAHRWTVLLYRRLCDAHATVQR